MNKEAWKEERESKKENWKLALYVGWPLLAVLNALDVWSTTTLLNEAGGRVVEGNPITSWFINHSLFIPAKILVVLVAGILCLTTDNPRHFAIMLWLIIPIYVYVVITNIGYM